MAFNPFHSFRRYQKAIMAALAIFCMVVFVLTVGSGAGILEQFSELFGRGRGSVKDAVATLDGKKIDGLTVDQTRRSRKLANEFITMVVDAAVAQVIYMTEQPQNLTKLDPQIQQTIFQYNRVLRSPNINDSQKLEFISSVRTQLMQQLAVIQAGNAANKREQVNLVGSYSEALARFQQKIVRLMYAPGQGYFGGDPDKIEDTLDFLIWKREADKLGIRITNENVATLNSIEMFNQVLIPEVLAQVDITLKHQFAEFSIDRLNDALADEYRVRLAKSSLAGEQGATRTALPAEPTPDELYDWYRDVRTTVRAGLIEIPVAKYLDKVTERPTEAQLKELYDKHKNDEYNPGLERPGFKDPRKVKVEWLAAPTDSEFYKKAAETVAGPLFQVMRQFGSAALPTADGTPLMPFGAIFALHPAVADARTTFHYLDYLSAEPSWFNQYGFGGRRSGLHDSSVMRAENAATFVGSAIGGLATDAGPFLGPLAMETRSVFHEVRDRARIGTSILLAATLDPVPWGIDALALYVVPPKPTEAELRAELISRDRERLTSALVARDLQKFREELRKRAKEQDANNVQAFINEFIHARQFQRGGTAEAVDRFALPSSPGIHPLRVVYDKMNRRRDDPLGERFARELADYGPGNDFIPLPPENYAAENLDGDDLVYVHWRSEDRSPKVVPFDQAKPRVDAAWKFQKARELAKKEADRICTDARAASGDIQKLRDLAVQVSPRGLIELDPMAVWNSQVALTAGASTNYLPPIVPQTKVNYPGAMALELVDLRKSDSAPAIVVSDQPKAHYYVGALLSKDVPSIDSFRMSYKGWQGPATLRDPLFDIFIGERHRKYRADVMTQLRTEHKLEIYPRKEGEPSES